MEGVRSIGLSGNILLLVLQKDEYRGVERTQSFGGDTLLLVIIGNGSRVEK